MHFYAFFSDNFSRNCYIQLHVSSMIININLRTYWDVVAISSVAVTSIRKLGVVCDLTLRSDIFIGSVTHGPSSIVWRHVTVGLKCIEMASSIRVQPVHAITPGKTSFLNVQAMKPNKWTWTLKGMITESMCLIEVGLSVWLMTYEFLLLRLTESQVK